MCVNLSPRLGPKSDEGAGRRRRRRLAAGDTIINDRWTAGDNREGSGQEQTTTNHCHCALKADEWLPAERSAGDDKAKDDVDEEDEQRRGGF